MLRSYALDSSDVSRFTISIAKFIMAQSCSLALDLSSARWMDRSAAESPQTGDLAKTMPGPEVLLFDDAWMVVPRQCLDRPACQDSDGLDRSTSFYYDNFDVRQICWTPPNH